MPHDVAFCRVCGFPNPVGYQSKTTRKGKEMMTPTFQIVNGERGVWISDLKFAGFENNLDMMYDGNITFNIQIRDTDGKIAKDGKGVSKDFTWTQNFDAYSWMLAGEDPEAAAEFMLDSKWTNGKGETIVPHTESDFWLPAGTGIWLDAPGNSENDPEAEYTITFNGQVNLAECPVAFKKGKNPTGNMFPVGIRLSSLIPTGFENNLDMMYDGNITFNIQILASDGKIARDSATNMAKDFTYTQNFDAYSWMLAGEDPETAAEFMLDAKWTDGKGETVIAGSDNDPIFVAGEGLWLDAPGVSENDPEAVYSITFRAPTAK